MVLKQEDLTICNLENCFNEAMGQHKNYVGVLIQMQGFPKAEIIINENANIQAKLGYYKKAYNDDLSLKTFNGIKIIGFTHGDEFADIEYDLLMPKQ